MNNVIEVRKHWEGDWAGTLETGATAFGFLGIFFQNKERAKVARVRMLTWLSATWFIASVFAAVAIAFSKGEVQLLTLLTLTLGLEAGGLYLASWIHHPTKLRVREYEVVRGGYWKVAVRERQ